jgi:ribose transport system ATP-binding protein
MSEFIKAVAPDMLREAAIPPVIKLTEVKKNFGGIIALNGVSFSVKSGEVHGLVGENGAGKSTLIKILCGIFSRSAGEISLSGYPYAPSSPRDAKKMGLQVVHQEFNLLPFLSVAENLSIEHLPRNAFGVIKKSELNAQARSALDRIGLNDVDVDCPVERLGIAHRQLVEIARALMSDSRILILDEPTATLTSRETERLFGIIADLRSRGVSVVFVSHHLDEIFRICDSVTVLRNGETVFTKPIAETDQKEIVRAMVGQQLQREMSQEIKSSAGKDVVLSLVNFRHPQSRHEEGISLDLHKGEIVGIAGLVGSGRTELLRSIFAAQPHVSGGLLRNGKPVEFKSPREAIEAGMGFVTEDRKDEGLILRMPIAANVTLASLAGVSRGGLLSKGAEDGLTKKLGSDLKLKYSSPAKNVSTLSGGNQQKVVLAKWLARAPKILLLDEPTRGVDVGAKAEIYALIRKFAEEGLALLVVSSELPELTTLCDRILVMAKHRVVGEFSRSEFSEERILSYAYSGETKQTGH